ncbi:membrane protein [Massilimicrobiota timonensis]|uniref:hypothetical protein n=1 Tax=Massilimicrobiota timonensis TaxID=1776392 RepID=UPI0036F3E764
MKSHKHMQVFVLASLLIAVGTIIPMLMPKIIIGPMSFTLASHVAVMIAIFISPAVAIAVSLGTTLGFFMAGFPFVVVLRALTHVIWAYLGAQYAKMNPQIFEKPLKTLQFNIVIALIHALGEMIIVIPFYYGNGMDMQTFMYMIFGLVGLGTVIHSSIDFCLTLPVWKALTQSHRIQGISQVKKINLMKNA